LSAGTVSAVKEYGVLRASRSADVEIDERQSHLAGYELRRVYCVAGAGRHVVPPYGNYPGCASRSQMLSFSLAGDFKLKSLPPVLGC
jgi:hypothetical protein